jgi:hypothetical protein
MAPDSCCLHPTAINSRHQCRRARPATSAGTSFYAGDRESAFAFYSGLVGWTKAEAVESPLAFIRPLRPEVRRSAE